MRPISAAGCRLTPTALLSTGLRFLPALGLLLLLLPLASVRAGGLQGTLDGLQGTLDGLQGTLDGLGGALDGLRGSVPRRSLGEERQQANGGGAADPSEPRFDWLLEETPGRRLDNMRDVVRDGQSTETERAKAETHTEGEHLLHLHDMTDRFQGMKRRRAVHALRKYPKLDLSEPIVRRYADLVESSLAPWRGVSNSSDGHIHGRGIISPTLLAAMSVQPSFMSCLGHIKVVRGKLFYRYGGFLRDWYRNVRFVMTLKSIQLAIERFALHSISAELFVSTCDLPMSYDNSMAAHMGGYPIFTPHVAPSTTDIPYPDPVDLSGPYGGGSKEAPWEQKRSIAVFRGASTNFELHNDTNWRAAPRVRLHKMSLLRPDLLDAKLTRFTNIKQPNVLPSISAEIKLADKTDRGFLGGFKYEVDIDGGAGSGRTCGVLKSNRVLMKQRSPFSQFFAPLLKPYSHYIPVEHFLENMYDQVEWARAHDAEAQEIVERAHRVAQHACNWEGRVLFWAVLLVKYSEEAMEAPEAVEAPSKTCYHEIPKEGWSPVTPEVRWAALGIPSNWPPRCGEEEAASQPQCTFYCLYPKIKPEHHVWLSAESLRGVHLEDAAS